MRNLFLFLALALIPAAASAHALLEHASPAVGTNVAPTDTIRLSYSEGVEPRFSTIVVFGRDGDPLPADKPQIDPADRRVLILHLAAPLSPAKYWVYWHVLSVDTHRTEGSFSFMVVP